MDKIESTNSVVLMNMSTFQAIDGAISTYIVFPRCSILYPMCSLSHEVAQVLLCMYILCILSSLSLKRSRYIFCFSEVFVYVLCPYSLILCSVREENGTNSRKKYMVEWVWNGQRRFHCCCNSMLLVKYL